MRGRNNVEEKIITEIINGVVVGLDIKTPIENKKYNKLYLVATLKDGRSYTIKLVHEYINKEYIYHAIGIIIGIIHCSENIQLYSVNASVKIILCYTEE
jgi:hypothetical protein